MLRARQQQTVLAESIAAAITQAAAATPTLPVAITMYCAAVARQHRVEATTAARPEAAHITAVPPEAHTTVVLREVAAATATAAHATTAVEVVQASQIAVPVVAAIAEAVATVEEVHAAEEAAVVHAVEVADNSPLSAPPWGSALKRVPLANNNNKITT